MKIYLAAPLFSVAERTYNKVVAGEIGEVADVFLPQDSGLLLMDLLATGVNLGDAYKLIFDADWAAVQASDMLVAILDGACVDDGVAVEIGLARASNIVCIGLKTDWRTQLPTGDNPMVVGALLKIFTSLDQLVKYIHDVDNDSAYVAPVDLVR